MFRTVPLSIIRRFPL